MSGITIVQYCSQVADNDATKRKNTSITTWYLVCSSYSPTISLLLHLLTTTNMSFISVILSLQKVLYKWNHTVYNLWVKVAQSCPTLQPHGLYSPWHSPGQNTGVDSLSLLQGIFPTQGLNPGLPHYRQILYQVSLKGSPRILEWVKVKVKSLSRVRLLATPWTTAYQAPPFMGFSKQEYWSGCHCLLRSSTSN